MQYLAQLRLQLAAHQLCGNCATLPEIAGRAGYGSEAAFSHAFKRRLEVPPATWRARSAKAERAGG